MYRTIKRFGPYGCAHRNHHVVGHCSNVHGYGLTVTIQFEKDNVDEAGFVEDFGDFEIIKKQLEYWFDHKLVLSRRDPLLPMFMELQDKHACALTLMPESKTVSMEHRAEMIMDWLHLYEFTSAVSVEVREHENNAGSYTRQDNATD